MTRLVLSTANPDKLREIEPFFDGLDVDLVAVGELVDGWDVEETGATLEANARLKAEAAVRATGLPAVADDTGLFVDALGGAPGVRSSRFAGEEATYADNVARLLAEMAGIPEAERAARFRTVAVLHRPDGTSAAFEGVLEGRILEAPRGSEGFGYDPVFLVAGGRRSLAEIALDEKNRISHRAAAFRAVAAWLEARSGRPEGSGGS